MRLELPDPAPSPRPFKPARPPVRGPHDDGELRKVWWTTGVYLRADDAFRSMQPGDAYRQRVGANHESGSGSEHRSQDAARSVTRRRDSPCSELVVEDVHSELAAEPTARKAGSGSSVRRQAAAPPRLRGSGSRSVRPGRPRGRSLATGGTASSRLRAGVGGGRACGQERAREKGARRRARAPPDSRTWLSCPDDGIACFEAASFPAACDGTPDARSLPFAGAHRQVRERAARRLASADLERPSRSASRGSRRSRIFGSVVEESASRGCTTISPPCECPRITTFPPAVVVAHVVEERVVHVGLGDAGVRRFTSGLRRYVPMVICRYKGT